MECSLKLCCFRGGDRLAVLFFTVLLFFTVAGANTVNAAEEVSLKVFSEKKRQSYLKTNPTPPIFEEIITPPTPTPPEAPSRFSGLLVDENNSGLGGARVMELSGTLPEAVTDSYGAFSFSSGLPSNPLFMAYQEGKLPHYFSPPDSGDALMPIIMYERHSEQPTPNAIIVEADTFHYENIQKTITANGAVRVRRHNDVGELKAERISFNGNDDIVSGFGAVEVVGYKDTVRGDSFAINSKDFTGDIANASLFLQDGNYHISGASIAKIGEASYRVADSVVTTCAGDCPDWYIKASKAGITVDGYGYAQNAVLYGGKVPLLYIPYIVFPAKKTRQSGLLAPYFAFSNDKLGFDVEVPLYLAISENTDATFYHREMSKRGSKEALEFRYTGGDEHHGTIYGDFFNDRGAASNQDAMIGANQRERWSFYLNHYSQLGEGAYLQADIAKLSDRWYFKDFSSHNYYLTNKNKDGGEKFRGVAFVGDEALNALDATVRIAKNGASYGVTALFKYTKDLTRDSNENTTQKYPEVTANIIKQPLFGSPVFFEMANIAGYYYSSNISKSGYVGDLKPSFSLPMQYNYFHIIPRLEAQTTLWEKNGAPFDNASQGVRNIVGTGLTFNTELSRIYDFKLLGIEKIKHTIKPEISYDYTTLSTNSAPLPDFVLPLNSTNVVTYSLSSDIIVRELDAQGNPNYRQALRAKIYQNYNIDAARRSVNELTNLENPFGEMGIDVDFEPHRYLNFRLRDTFSPEKGKLTTESYEVNVSDYRGDNMSLAYRYSEDLLLREVELAIGAPINANMMAHVRRRLDLFNKRNIEAIYALTYKKQCWDISMAYTEKTSVDVYGIETPDRTFTFLINLYGLGGFGF